MKTFANTLTTVSRQYGVSRKTLKKWLLDYPQINLKKGTRVIPPKVVDQIYDCLGKPPEFDKRK